MLLAGMFRLQRKEPYVVVGDVRGLHLPRLLSGAPRARRAHLIRALHTARYQLDMEAASQHAARREQQGGTPPDGTMLLHKFLTCLLIAV